MSSKIKLTILSQPQRADSALIHHLREKGIHFSRSFVKDLFKKKLISIGNHPLSASALLSEGEYSLSIPESEWNELLHSGTPVAAPHCSLPILYEDPSLLVLHKPSGMPSAPLSSEDSPMTAVGEALSHYPNLAEVVSDKPLEPGLLHRLDTGTSGILVFAKTYSDFEYLKQEWKKRRVRKIYRALVAENLVDPAFSLDKLKKGPAEIQFPLAHEAKSKKKMRAIHPNTPLRSSEIRGKPLPALTRILKITETQLTSPSKKRIFDFTVEIETGVMHQIRCHLDSIGFPILGDTIYGKETCIGEFLSIPNRLWLHAWKLELPTQNQTRLLLQSKLPEHWPS